MSQLYKRFGDDQVKPCSVGLPLPERSGLITSIDDYSRMLLFADFVPNDTTWAHIEAVRTLTQFYGIPLRYYVDSLRVFRFVQGRDSVWRKHILQTDEVDIQWSKILLGPGAGSWVVVDDQAGAVLTIELLNDEKTTHTQRSWLLDSTETMDAEVLIRNDADTRKRGELWSALRAIVTLSHRRVLTRFSAGRLPRLHRPL